MACRWFHRPLTAWTGCWLMSAVRARSFGMLPPMFGDLTPLSVAYCCLLAGCVPAELPVVMTAAVACQEPDFNLLGLLTTNRHARRGNHGARPYRANARYEFWHQLPGPRQPGERIHRTGYVSGAAEHCRRC